MFAVKILVMFFEFACICVALNFIILRSNYLIGIFLILLAIYGTTWRLNTKIRRW